MLPSLTAAHSHANGLRAALIAHPEAKPVVGQPARRHDVLFRRPSKNAPLMTDQSPSSHARTSSGEPDIRELVHVASPTYWLSATRDGI